MKNIIPLFLFIFSFINIQAQQTKTNYPTTIPTFQFDKIIGNGKFNSSDIIKNKKTIIAFVSPECMHCILAIEHLNTNSNLLKNTNLIIVTEYQKDEFLNRFDKIAPQLKELKYIEVLQDSNYEFIELFNPLSLPTFYLYDKNGILETVKRGSVEVNQIFNYIK